jgi:hypothetical protein
MANCHRPAVAALLDTNYRRTMRWVRRADGVVDMTRTVGGEVRCTLCLVLAAASSMFVDAEGRVWDVCQDCADDAAGYAERDSAQ